MDFGSGPQQFALTNECNEWWQINWQEYEQYCDKEYVLV